MPFGGRLPLDPICHMLKLFPIPDLSIGQPMILKCSIHSQPITILIDFEAACNLLHIDVAHQLDLPIEIVAAVHFTTASHKQFAASLRAHNVEVKLQGYTLRGSFLLLNIPDYDLILGSEWLESLGFISWNFKNKTMIFHVQDTTYTLQGLVTAQPTFQACHSIQPLSPNNHPFLNPTPTIETSLSPPPSTHPAIVSLLIQYQHLFSVPSGLPPQCQIDHKIPLLPNTTLVNVYPYRYLHSQKAEIERQVQELLHSGVIRNSSNPFSSLVPLVKKKGRFLVSLY